MHWFRSSHTPITFNLSELVAPVDSAEARHVLENFLERPDLTQDSSNYTVAEMDAQLLLDTSRI